MTQYCRYCSLASLQDDDLIYCEARKEIRDKKKIVSPNRCKQFEFNPVDVQSVSSMMLSSGSF